MNGPEFTVMTRRERLGLKGSGAAQWLMDRGCALPPTANSWSRAAPPDSENEAPLVARLGQSEFFLEEGARGSTVRRLSIAAYAHPLGVYPVLREDAAFLLSGIGSDEVLAQVCSVNFGEVAWESQPVIMTLMVGVAVLIVPEDVTGGQLYRIWCDPTFGEYLGDELRAVVDQCGGSVRGTTT